MTDRTLMILQWVYRNDAEEQVSSADVIAFDRAVTLEGKRILESCDAARSRPPLLSCANLSPTRGRTGSREPLRLPSCSLCGRRDPNSRQKPDFPFPPSRTSTAVSRPASRSN
jgi:hypothetical protein